MRYLFKLLFLSAFVFAIGSCKKDENKIYFEGGTAPVLTANVSGTVPMSFATADKEAVRLTWTNPDYSFTTGSSSQDVNYLLEIDTTGSNFTNPKKRTLAIKSNLSKTITQAEMNDYLLNTLELKPGMAHNIEVRVTASLSGNSVPLFSNVVKFVVTPYSIPPKINPPSSGKLYITGGATPASWQCGCGEAELLSQKFTQISPTLYVIPSITLKANESFLFLPVYGSWSEKYGYTGDGNKNNVDGDEFKNGGNDIKSPATTGNYKIEVNFQTGKYTLTKL